MKYNVGDLIIEKYKKPAGKYRAGIITRVENPCPTAIQKDSHFFVVIQWSNNNRSDTFSYDDLQWLLNSEYAEHYSGNT